VKQKKMRVSLAKISGLTGTKGFDLGLDLIQAVHAESGG
jgi:hypothetical protein